MPALDAQTIRDFTAEIRRSTTQPHVDAAIKDLPDSLNKLRQQGLFRGAEWTDLRALLNHPDQWPFPSEFGAEIALVGGDVRLAVGLAIAFFFLPPDDATAKTLGLKATDPGDNEAACEAPSQSSCFWLYCRRALLAVADRLDEEAKRIDAALTAAPGGPQAPAAVRKSTAAERKATVRETETALDKRKRAAECESLDPAANLSRLMALPAETEWLEFKEAKNFFDFRTLGQYFSALSNEANLKAQPWGWLILGVSDKVPRQVVGTHYKSHRSELDALKKQIADQTGNQITFEEIYEVRRPAGRVLMFQIPPAPRAIPTAFQGHYYGRDNESLGALNIQEIERIRGQ